MIPCLGMKTIITQTLATTTEEEEEEGTAVVDLDNNIVGGVIVTQVIPACAVLCNIVVI